MSLALVTGARPGGIGEAVARRLASDGAQVVTQTLPGEGGDVVADFLDPGAPGQILDAIGEPVDWLIACHARSSDFGLLDVTASELDLTWAVNTRATLLLVRLLAERRPAGPGGRVVLFTSGQYHGAMPGELAYIASKGALHQVTPTLAIELAPRGITVNCVDPGPNDTGWASDDVRSSVLANAPGGRWGTPADAARLVAWLVSDEADWVTGQVIASDGGWSSR